MEHPALRVLAVVGSLNPKSGLSVVVHHMAEKLAEDGCSVNVLDLEKEPLAHFNPETAHSLPGYAALQARVDRADVLVFATPDYHGCVSGTIKNFLDHFWCEFAGKLFVTLVASHEKGLTVADQLRTVARQCYAWSLPYGAAFAPGLDVKEGQIISDGLKERLEMMVRDLRVYGELISGQRRADLAGTGPGFMARHRK
jgi:NAD(P)H-dependent FMN reductase